MQWFGKSSYCLNKWSYAKQLVNVAGIVSLEGEAFVGRVVLDPALLIRQDGNKIVLTKAGYLRSSVSVIDSEDTGVAVVAAFVFALVRHRRLLEGDAGHGRVGILHGLSPSLHINNAPFDRPVSGAGRRVGLARFFAFFRHGGRQIGSHCGRGYCCVFLEKTEQVFKILNTRRDDGDGVRSLGFVFRAITSPTTATATATATTTKTTTTITPSALPVVTGIKDRSSPLFRFFVLRVFLRIAVSHYDDDGVSYIRR